MSWFKENLDIIEVGFDGEGKIRDWFKNKRIPFMQVDIMFKYKNKWCLGEIKTQEVYVAPPYDGHGLPAWQIERRMEFFKDTGIEPFLIVYDIKEKCLYLQSLVILLDGEHFKTKGKKPRTIFKLDNFKRIEL
tara:strand:- start:162 stop:560 length:399 start_codon:yes stop_codon:yes gene_type:complete